MERCRRRYGDVFSISMVGMETPSVWVTDPELIKRLYSRDRENLVPAGAEPTLEPMFGRR
jgi:hypothetical protein